MVIWTARFSKKAKAVLVVIVLGLIAAAVILLAGGQDSGTGTEIRLTSNEERVAYLQSLGWTGSQSRWKHCSFFCRKNW